MDTSRLMVREPETAMLFGLLQRSGSLVELVATPGMGKTSLLKTMADRYQAHFQGAIEFFAASPSFSLGDAIDEIAKSFQSSPGQNLLIIDDAEILNPGEILEAINQLSAGPWQFSTALGTRHNIGIGHRFELHAIPHQTFLEFAESRLKRQLPAEMLEQIWTATRGNPALSQLLIDRLNAGLLDGADDLSRLLAPLRSSGLVGPDGRPLEAGGKSERELIKDVRFVSDEILRKVAANPNTVFDISSRRFEELVAELLDRMGYEVRLTSATRDGGKDMYAAKRDDLGSFLYIVECKRYAPDRPVGVGVVRELYGVAQAERVNAAIIMTTSFFSKPAEEYARDLRSMISLKDFFDLKDWLQKV